MPSTSSVFQALSGQGTISVQLYAPQQSTRESSLYWAFRFPTDGSRDGYTPGITLPSADAQEKVIRKAYAKAGLDFADTDYVECHGTGTAVGDPIEVDALSRCFTPRLGESLLVGSVSVTSPLDNSYSLARSKQISGIARQPVVSRRS
jgi:hypothetical protein